ncbi:MAG: methionine synthase [Alistipes sp.]|nr:methionine synthase [Alistipes sp.]
MAHTIEKIIGKRILILDGAMGTMIQRHKLSEEDFRGDILRHHDIKLEGNNDLLALTRPDLIASIHRQYLEAGADIITTCTFNAQAVSQSEYHTENLVRKINLSAAQIARNEADRMTLLTPDKPRFVAGSIGPTGKTASISPDVDNPAIRTIDFDTLREAYMEQIEALVEGGVDVLLMETQFDTLNTKAALDAAHEVFRRHDKSVPIMVSITIADKAGRMLAGQTVEAFLTSIAHANIFSVGINCSFGAEEILPLLKQMAAHAPYYISTHPNAGIPNEMGEYNQTPDVMSRNIEPFIRQELVNIIGGCCGTTPEHIRAIAEVASSATTIHHPTIGHTGWLAGLDEFYADKGFINIGERCNVAGSRKFLRLIKEKAYDEALSIARSQVRAGAMILDINMDDGMIDTRHEMCHFLNLMASDPEIARLPWMVDSSRFEVIEAALKMIQGKAIVNSLSLKEGEAIFLERAAKVKQLGAALVVMAFDEEGQATTFERKIEVCARAYRLLTEKLNFNAEDIIFDPNILTIATGMREHDNYALDFIRATEWIHKNLPQAKVSGGVSNLSFALRGNNYLREAMHAVFLYHAIAAGLDMAIVNPTTSVMYSDIPSELLEALEDVILARKEDATERLLSLAGQYNNADEPTLKTSSDRKQRSVAERLATALQQGDNEYLADDIAEALSVYPTPSAIIEGPLMQGMTNVGELFGAGKMFLPQVVKSARTMKRAVEILQPHIEAGHSATTSNGRYLLATVKGDVHDIGKNIAAVVLACNNFEVIDLGVMVSAEQIVKAAKEEQVDYIGLSGLITPSLDEMCHVADTLREANIDKPLFIGGATTSALHTALKIAPLYGGPVFHVKDASQNPILAMQISSDNREDIINELYTTQEILRKQHSNKQSANEDNADNILHIDWSKEQITTPSFEGVRTIDISIAEIRRYINWIHFYNLWGIAKGSPEAEKLKLEAEALLNEIATRHALIARVGFFKAYGNDNSIVISHAPECPCCGGLTPSTTIATPRQLQTNNDGYRLALCDFVAPKEFDDHIGAFAITISGSFVAELEQAKTQGDEYRALMLQSLGDRLAEAASEWLHEKCRKDLWGYAPEESLSIKEMFQAAYRGIRPAIGYPSLPDQRTIFPIAKLLDIEQIGITLTENGAMYPQSSVCGLYIASPHAKYFVIK